MNAPANDNHLTVADISEAQMAALEKRALPIAVQALVTAMGDRRRALDLIDAAFQAIAHGRVSHMGPEVA